MALAAQFAYTPAMRRVLRGLAIATGVLLLLFFVLIGLARFGVVGAPRVPEHAIETSVDRRPQLLDRAFALPVASRYGREPYFQTHGSYCGPASLVNVFRSLGDAVADENALLAGSGKCSLGFCFMGLSLDELADVARGRGRSVQVLRDLSPEAFQEHLRRSNDPTVRYIVNFAREKIFAAGGGHHSPIGGYLEAEDLVLVLDTNATFRPWLVERERLYAAMNTRDGEATRGLLLIQ